MRLSPLLSGHNSKVNSKDSDGKIRPEITKGTRKLSKS